MTDTGAVLAWLLDSDPSIRWQVMRDLLDAPEAEWAVERAKVETEGWGARLLAHEDEDGQWAGGAFIPSGFDSATWQREGQDHGRPPTRLSPYCGSWGPTRPRIGCGASHR
jgi:hypothetical protein